VHSARLKIFDNFQWIHNFRSSNRHILGKAILFQGLDFRTICHQKGIATTAVSRGLSLIWKNCVLRNPKIEQSIFRSIDNDQTLRYFPVLNTWEATLGNPWRTFSFPRDSHRAGLWSLHSIPLWSSPEATRSDCDHHELLCGSGRFIFRIAGDDRYLREYRTRVLSIFVKFGVVFIRDLQKQAVAGASGLDQQSCTGISLVSSVIGSYCPVPKTISEIRKRVGIKLMGLVKAVGSHVVKVEAESAIFVSKSSLYSSMVCINRSPQCFHFWHRHAFWDRDLDNFLTNELWGPTIERWWSKLNDCRLSDKSYLLNLSRMLQSLSFLSRSKDVPHEGTLHLRSN
jgi:hypothetical protein